MLGKLLLLALVCVAANSQVPGNDLQLETEEALRQARSIFDKMASSIRYTIEVYMHGYWMFYKTAQDDWPIICDYTDEELEEVKMASLELTEMAKEQNSPEEVFTCISNKTQKASEMLKVIPWTFDRKIFAEAKRFHDDHNEIGQIGYDYQDTYQAEYKSVVKRLQECDNNEDLDKILEEYEDETNRKMAELAEALNKLDVHSEEFRQLSENMLAAVRGTFTFARIAGVDDIKKCMTLIA